MAFLHFPEATFELQTRRAGVAAVARLTTGLEAATVAAEVAEATITRPAIASACAAIACSSLSD